jgi:two-component system chemotaxis response regulator CheY
MKARFTTVCIEDDLDARVLFRHAVDSLGGTLIEATNVTDGLAAIREHRPQLVLLDLALPGESGWTVVETVRADDGLRQTPIIVVTIKDFLDERYRGRHVDWVQGYVTKPFEISVLEQHIRRALEL